jgi:DNA replication protein DnaC
MILEQLRWLRLPGMARALEAMLARVKKTNMTPLDIVGALADAEKASRIESAVKRRVYNARFAEISTLDNFDFSFDPVRRKAKARYLALADLGFLERGV